MKEPAMKPFFVLWTGQALSLVGSQAVQFALIWWLTRETGSATVLAAAALLAFAPTILLGPFVGALVDRWDRKRVMLAADAGIALASVVLAVLFLTGTVRVWHVFLLLFVRALGAGFYAPAMLASTSLMVPKRHLTRIQGLNQALQGGQLILSAPLGALLVASLPMAGVMTIDVGTALFAIVPLLFLRVPRPDRTASKDEASGSSVLRDVREGFRYILDRSGHVALLVLAAVVNLSLVPAFSLLPLLVLERGGGAMQLGGMSALFGVGTIVGGVALGVWGGFRRRIYTSLAGLIGLGAATLLLGLAPSVTGMVLAIFAVGFLAPLTNGPIQAVLQATVPPEIQGRVFTLYGSLAALMTPVGLVLAAPVAERMGVSAWYLAGGLACLAMGALGFLLPSLVRIEECGVGRDSPLGAAPGSSAAGEHDVGLGGAPGAGGVLG